MNVSPALLRTAILGCAVVLGALVLTGAAPAQEPPPAPRTAATPVDLGTTAAVRIQGCSGALVRPPGAADDDQALLLTNGHCATVRPLPGEVLADEPENRLVRLLDAAGAQTGLARTDRLLYATMTATDLSL